RHRATLRAAPRRGAEIVAAACATPLRFQRASPASAYEWKDSESQQRQDQCRWDEDKKRHVHAIHPRPHLSSVEVIPPAECHDLKRQLPVFDDGRAVWRPRETELDREVLLARGEFAPTV